MKWMIFFFLTYNAESFTPIIVPGNWELQGYDRPIYSNCLSMEDYFSATHDHELIRRRETFVHIDAAHGPIGSEMAWSSVMPVGYNLGGGSYCLEFEMDMD